MYVYSIKQQREGTIRSAWHNQDIQKGNRGAAIPRSALCIYISNLSDAQNALLR